MSTLKAARADNFYFPDPTTTIMGRYAPKPKDGKRPERIGVSNVRFEIPYHIRCTKCENMIAKGVRFNASKKQGRVEVLRSVGKYLSSAIIEFWMNCHRCSNKLVIRTNPEKCEYDLIEGCVRKVEEFDVKKAETLEFRTPEERAKLANDGFMRLENEKDDFEKAEEEKPFLQELQQKQSRLQFDANLNSKLRKAMRVEKKELKRREDQRSFVEKNLGSLGPKDFKVSESQKRLLQLKKYKGNYAQNQQLLREKLKRGGIFKRQEKQEEKKQRAKELLLKQARMHLKK